MKAVAVIRHPCGAVDEVPIQGSPEAINQLVEDGWEIEVPWSWSDTAALVGWLCLGLVIAWITVGL